MKDIKPSIDANQRSQSEEIGRFRGTNLNKSKRSKWSIFMVVLLLFASYFATDIGAKYYNLRKYESEKNKLTNELIHAEKEIKELKNYIKNAQNPQFVEKIARENLKMVRPDETVYVVVK